LSDLLNGYFIASLQKSKNIIVLERAAVLLQ